MFFLTWPDIVLCIDIDELVDSAAFKELQCIANQNKEITLFQAFKHDFPHHDSFWGKAFEASYSTWFYWESGWEDPGKGYPFLGCSYYGSMASIRISPELLEHKKIALRNGQIIQGYRLFPEGYNIEDCFLPNIDHRRIDTQGCIYYYTIPWCKFPAVRQEYLRWLIVLLHESAVFSSSQGQIFLFLIC